MKHHIFLIEALKLAKERRGFCSPNPAVGAVVVQAGVIIARGSHYAAGEPHAEVMACQNLPSDLKNAILYVTLEPCCHFGKTPPCTDLIIKTGIKKVIYGFQDPNPIVAGKSARLLLQEGIECQQIDLPEINEFYRSYAHWVVTQRPWITCKLAMSLDAKIADANRQPVTITGEEAKQFTHENRLRSDAILTSVRTISNDDPALNARLNNQIVAKPLYVIDSCLSLPLTAKIFTTALSITLFHSCRDELKITELNAKGVKCIYIPKNNSGLSLISIVNSIGHDGIHDLWVEAGRKIFSAFFQEGLAQKGFIYIAPKLLGAAAYPAFSEDFNLFGKTQMVNWQSKGDDVICEISM